MKQKGFTLIELLVVIAIIALLLSIIMPSLRKAKDAAKLMICASNQHQCLSGVQIYAVDNDGLYPPHAAERKDETFSWVNYLNYQQKAGTRAKNEGTYYYLGSYLPTVDILACPLGPAKPSKDLQYQYEDYKNPAYGGAGAAGTHVSYNMYWGGYKMENVNFYGPTGKDSNKKTATLLISDGMNSWLQNQWWLSHRPKKGNILKQQFDPVFQNDCSIFWVLDQSPNDPPYELKMNAGYADGSVRRYAGDETVRSERVSGSIYFHIPKKFR
jgi:prepilin-type N-terminal cleavage/methylation domain-containing protein